MCIVVKGAILLRTESRSKSGSFVHDDTTIAAAAEAAAGGGHTGVTANAQPQTVLGPGDYFNSEALLVAATGTDFVMSMDARALEEGTQVLTVSAKDFESIVGREWITRYAKKTAQVDTEADEAKAGGASDAAPTEAKVDGSRTKKPGHSKRPASLADVLAEAEANGESPASTTASGYASPRLGRSASSYSLADIAVPDTWRDQSIASLDDLQFMQTLGKGSFGKVILAQVKAGDDGKLVAVKKLAKADLVQNGCAPHVMNERIALALSSGCPYIIDLYQTFQDSRYLYFVLELCRGGDLFGLLCKTERVLEKSARFYAASVLCAFAHMHKQDIVYRDLKPENLLIQEDGYLKVADLGLAKAVPDGLTYTLCGTPVYMSPEMLLSKGHGKAADAWAVGIMIYELCAGYPPFEGEDQMETYELIINSNVIWPTPDLAQLHSPAEQTDEAAAAGAAFAGAAFVPAYKFGSAVKELINGLLTKDAARRLGSATAHQAAFEDVRRCAWYSRFDWRSFDRQTMPVPCLPEVKDWQDNFDSYEEEDGMEAEPEPVHGDDFDDFDR